MHNALLFEPVFSRTYCIFYDAKQNLNYLNIALPDYNLQKWLSSFFSAMHLDVKLSVVDQKVKI